MNKIDFIKRAEAIEAMNNTLYLCLNRADEVISKFDGKVVNARLKNAIQKELDSLWEGKTVSIRDNRIWIYNSVGRFYFNERGNVVYLSRDSAAFVYVLNEEGRLDSEKTHEKIAEVREILDREIEDHKEAIKGWDEYEAMTKEMEAKIAEYKKNCHYLVRKNIEIRKGYYE